jgi:D-hexose-6-phosphate mutarotase
MELQLPSSVRREEGPGGLGLYIVENAHATAQIFEQGAHVAAFHPRASLRPLLWMSQSSHYATEQPLRGGVPICFPWFGPRAEDPSAPAHGVARIGDWVLRSASDEASGTRLTFAPAPELEEQPLWPHSLRVSFEVLVGAALELRFSVANERANAFDYEIALHTYFAVGDVRTVEVSGLEGVPFWDKVRRVQQKGERGALRPSGEVDRVYGSTSTCVLRDAAWDREITVEKEGSKSTVVWNPHEKKAAAMEDFGDAEWPQMLCIETANVGQNRVHLKAGESHSTVARLSVRDSAR